MKGIYAVTFVFGLLFVFSSCKRHNGCNWSEKAWIRDYSSDIATEDTCGIVIELEDHTKLEPTNLPSFPNLPYNDGDLVWVSYKPTSGASTCGLGDIVKIRCIVEREY